MYMEKRLAVIILILCSNFNICYGGRYENYSIYTIYPQSQMHHNFLLNLHEKQHLDLIFLDMPPENIMYQVLVHNVMEDDFEERTKHFLVKVKKHSENAQQLFDEPLKQFYKASQLRSKYTYFQSLDEIYKWLYDTAEKYPNVKVESIGKSVEGRDILVFSVEEPPRANYSNLNVIIESGIHGNEWMGPAFTTYMIEQVLTAIEGPYEKLRRRYFLHFLPILNPDGYVYSQTEDRLWKKNRRSVNQRSKHPGDTGGTGVNLNRNFDYNWGGDDSSDDPASEKYRGPHPFSEPETVAFRDFVSRKHSQLIFYFSMHGHGQKFILPYSDSVKHVVNYHEVQSFAKRAARQIEGRNNRIYRIGLSSEIMGRKYCGDSTSWVKKYYQIPYTYAIQLRDDGEYGYVMRSDSILPACEEMSDAVTSIMVNSGRYRVIENDADSSVQSRASVWLISGVIAVLEINVT